MTRTKQQNRARQELESRLERARVRLTMAQEHHDLARVANLQGTISELEGSLRKLQEGVQGG